MKKLLFVLLSVFALGLMVSCSPEVPVSPEKPAETEDKTADISGKWVQNLGGQADLFYTFEKDGTNVKKGTALATSCLYQYGLPMNISIEAEYTLDGTSFTLERKHVYLELSGVKQELTSEDLKTMSESFPETIKGTYEVTASTLLVTDTSAETPVTYKFEKQTVHGNWNKSLIAANDFSTTKFTSAAYSFKANNIAEIDLESTDKQNWKATGSWNYSDGKISVSYDTLYIDEVKNETSSNINTVNAYYGLTNKPCVVLNNTFYFTTDDGQPNVFFFRTYTTTELEDSSVLSGNWEEWNITLNQYVKETFSFTNNEIVLYRQVYNTSYRGTWTYTKPTLTFSFTELYRNEVDKDWTASESTETYTLTTNGDVLIIENSTGTKRYLLKK